MQCVSATSRKIWCGEILIHCGGVSCWLGRVCQRAVFAVRKGVRWSFPIRANGEVSHANFCCMNTNNSGFAAFRIVATYVFLALIWIASSDTLLVKGISGANTRALWGMGKGFVFVAVTATVLFTLVSRRLRERDVALASQAQALVKEQAASHMLKDLVRISALRSSGTNYFHQQRSHPGFGYFRKCCRCFFRCI